MSEINKKLLSGTDYHKILDFVFDSLDLVIPYDRIDIAILDESTDSFSIVWVRSKVPVTHLRLASTYPLLSGSLQEVLDTGRPRVVDDLISYSADHPDSKAAKLAILDGIRSHLICPLQSNDQKIGVIFFSSCHSETYHDKHGEIFTTIADELSMIVDNGRVRKDLALSQAQAQSMGMMVHDLKTPLSVIQWFTESSFGKEWFPTLDPDGKKTFEILQRNSRYMFELMTEMVEMDQLKSEASAVLSKDVPMAAFCKEISHYGKILAEAKEIHFVSEVCTGVSSVVQFDRHKISRVLENLFSNAVKYSKRGGDISFQVSEMQGQLTFAVTDKGLGISESEWPKIFQEFGKASGRPTEGETSTGLGLAIARKIVEAHHGEISLESEVGQGSTFRFWIPTVGGS